MKRYIIYHVVGCKVGCTRYFAERSQQNRMTYGQNAEIVPLEEFVGDEQHATEREKHWAKVLGYRLGNPYTNAIEAQRARGRNGARHPGHPSNRPDLVAHWAKAGMQASQASVTCPHCGAHGARRAMVRWHFDRCKKKPLTEQLQLP